MINNSSVLMQGHHTITPLHHYTISLHKVRLIIRLIRRMIMRLKVLYSSNAQTLIDRDTEIGR